MAEMSVVINMTVDQESLLLDFFGNGKPLAKNSIALKEINLGGWQYLSSWLFYAAKELFSQMPVVVPAINVNCTPEIWASIGAPVSIFMNFLKNTNSFISENAHLKDKATPYTKVLFYGLVGDDRFFSFFKNCNEMDPEHVLYRDMDAGWDNDARKFDDTKCSFMPMQELIKFIIGENIRKIVTVNRYYIEMLLRNEGLNVVPVLAFMGVELVTIDVDSCIDPFNGYLHKAAFSYGMFHQFSMTPTLEKYNDVKYNLKHIYYVASPQNYGNLESSFNIEDDYSLVVMSNSRLVHVVPDIYPILYLFDFLDEDRMLQELQLWWLAQRWLILHGLNFNEVEQRMFDSRLLNFFYSECLSFLKYLIIDGIQTDRKVLLYGDEHWRVLFPEYYQKFLGMDEKDELFSNKHYLHILMNISLTYPEAHPGLSDSLMRAIPFVACSTLVKTPPYSGFRHIEYNNIAELNSLIEDIRSSLSNAEFNKSVRNYKELTKTNLTEVADNIVFNKVLPADGGVYLRECEENTRMLNLMIQEYIKNRGTFLRDSFDSLFLKNKQVTVDPSKSKYFGKKFVQKILSLYHYKINETKK